MNIDINKFNVSENNIAMIVNEQIFWIGPNADINVTVNLYEHKGKYKMTSWLNGVEELNTTDYEGSIDNAEEILSAMEKLISDNEDYILSIAL